MRAAAFVVFCAAASLAAGAENPKYLVLDGTKVYLGDRSAFENPATVAAGEVLSRTREFRLINERKLGRADPEYWVLLFRANESFRCAVRRVAARASHDLVAERNFIVAATPGAVIPDMTHLVIAEVERRPEGRS